MEQSFDIGESLYGGCRGLRRPVLGLGSPRSGRRTWPRVDRPRFRGRHARRVRAPEPAARVLGRGHVVGVTHPRRGIVAGRDGTRVASRHVANVPARRMGCSGPGRPAARRAERARPPSARRSARAASAARTHASRLAVVGKGSLAIPRQLSSAFDPRTCNTGVTRWVVVGSFAVEWSDQPAFFELSPQVAARCQSGVCGLIRVGLVPVRAVDGVDVARERPGDHDDAVKVALEVSHVLVDGGSWSGAAHGVSPRSGWRNPTSSHRR